MTAITAKLRLIRVLADDHGRGTRHLTSRDISVHALEMYSGTSLRQLLVKAAPADLAVGQPIRIKSIGPR